MRILVVDDDRDCCDSLFDFLNGFVNNSQKFLKTDSEQAESNSVTRAYTGKEALSFIEKERFGLIICDVGLPDISGIEVAKSAVKLDSRSKVILTSGNEEIIQTINSIGSGVFDFLIKPVDVKKLASIIKKGEEYQQNFQGELNMIRNRIDKNPDGFLELEIIDRWNSLVDSGRIPQGIGIFSEKIEAIYKKIMKLWEYPQIPLLIHGETGTGKEVLARFSHFENAAAIGPFIGFNCSNLSRELFESELFGYEKGAFTGALTSGRDGKIKSAENGTLFLDEITEIPLDIQPKLLRVIEEREFFKLGSNKKEKVNCRLIFASNKNIGEMVKKGLFREDLYFRINICEVVIPALRERKNEIIPLVLFLLRQSCAEFGKKISKIENKALKLFEDHAWPGNIREMKNVITKLVLFNESGEILREQAADFISSHTGGPNIYKISQFDPEIPDKPFSLDELENAIIKKTIKLFNGNKTKASEYLGISRIQLYGRFKDAIDNEK